MNVNIKFGAHGTSLGHPLARPEDDCASGVVIQQITDCPDDMPPGAVLRQRDRVIVLPSLALYVPWSAIAGKPQGAVVRL
jgi:hypothetical protein